MFMSVKEKVIEWLSDGKENAKNLVDLPWKLSEDPYHLIMENENVPFAFLLGFHPDTIHITVRTGIETAVMDSMVRLNTYRTLLILNQRIDISKFMLFGMNEEVISRVDLAVERLTKSELNLGLNILLSSLYMMVRALKLEEQFNKQVAVRMHMMIEDMVGQGKSKEEIKVFLTDKVGINKDEAEKIVNEVLRSRRAGEDMQGLYA